MFEGINLGAPMLRVNNREQNIAFYRDQLGFKVLYEENALVYFGGYSKKQERFSIEESPSMRVRAVEGPKKLAKTLIKVEDPEEITALLARGAGVKRLFKGVRGYAFEVVSPENDLFLLHAEADPASLQEISPADLELEARLDFQGLSDFQVQQLVLNVADLAGSKGFYQHLAGLSFLPDLQAAQGEDLQAAPNTTWDLELLEYRLPKDCDLANLKAYLEERGLEVYLDKAERVLVLSDPSNIEIWFRK